MTDKEILEEMLTRIGIRLEPPSPSADPLDGWMIRALHQGKPGEDQGPQVGYYNFFVEILFNEDGSLKSIGAWE